MRGLEANVQPGCVKERRVRWGQLATKEELRGTKPHLVRRGTKPPSGGHKSVRIKACRVRWSQLTTNGLLRGAKPALGGVAIFFNLLYISPYSGGVIWRSIVRSAATRVNRRRGV